MLVNIILISILGIVRLSSNHTNPQEIHNTGNHPYHSGSNSNVPLNSTEVPNDKLYYIETNISKADLKKLFEANNFEIVQAINPSVLVRRNKKEEKPKENSNITYLLKKRNNKTDNRALDLGNRDNKKQKKKGSKEEDDEYHIVLPDDEDYIDQIYDDEEEKQQREKLKDKKYHNEKDYDYDLIDYTQKSQNLLGVNKVVKTVESSIEVDEESFTYAYSIVTFLAVLILAVIGFRFLAGCDKSSDNTNNEQNPQDELLIDKV